MARLQLLGPVDLRDDSGRELTQLIGQTKRFALLAYLAGNAPQKFHRRDRLLALFWPESTTDQARHGLRQLLYELRNHLGENAIVSRGANEIALNEDSVTSDVAQLQDAIARGQLDHAAELYQGDFLDGFFVSGMPEVEEWLETRRAELRRVALDVLWRLVERYEAIDDLQGAVATGQRAVDMLPTDEVGVRRLLHLLREQGNFGEALRIYEVLVRHLADGFAAEPAPETKMLIAEIREEGNREPAQTAPTIRGSDDVARTGIHVDTQQTPLQLDAPRVISLFNHPIAAAALFGLASLGVVSIVNILVLELGLPDWVLHAAVGLLVVGLPIIVATAVAERQRVVTADRTIRRWLTWRRSLRGGGLAFTSLAAVTAGYMVSRASGIGSLGTLMAKGVLQEHDPVLLADFANHTTDATLGITVTELLRIGLTQSRTVRLVDPEMVRATLQRMLVDPDAPLGEMLAREAAEREGVTVVLAGDVLSVGQRYVIAAKLINAADGELLGAERVTAADDAGLIVAVDQLSVRLRERIGESFKDVRASPPLARVTTTSLPALRLYTEAMRYPGPRGLPLLEQAVALDTTFAMAYRRLSLMLRRAGQPDASVAAIRRAFELRDRLPDVERYLVMGFYYSDLDYDSAVVETSYRAALALDPDNYIALINLASAMSLSRRWGVRESLAVRAQAVRPTLVGFLNVLGAQLLQGKYTEAQETIDNAARARNVSGLTAQQFDLETARRQYDVAENVLRGDTVDADRIGWGNLMRLRGRVRAARQTFQDMISNETGPSGPPFRPLYDLAVLEADFGSPADAARLLEGLRVDSLPPLERHSLEPAELYAAIGDVDRAKALVRAFEQQGDSDLRHPAIRADLLRVSGEIAISERRFADAVVDFTAVNALSGQCTTCGLARLAYAWLMSDQPDSALSVYRRILTIPTNGLNDDDARWLPDTYRRLGELYEMRGDTTNAITYYNDFVELWKKADPELQPLVEGVKQRIANLGGEPSRS